MFTWWDLARLGALLCRETTIWMDDTLWGVQTHTRHFIGLKLGWAGMGVYSSWIIQILVVQLSLNIQTQNCDILHGWTWSTISWGKIVARLIRPWTLNRAFPSLNLPAAAVVPLGRALYPHCLVPWKGLKAIGPLVASVWVACFLSGQVK